MTQPTPRIIGSLRTLTGDRGAVRVEDVYDTDVDDLWTAVTDPARLARWIAQVDGEPRLGATVHVRFTSSWEGPVRVEVCDAPHRLVVLLDPGTDDETEVEAVLTAEGTGTRLVVEERGLPVAELPGHGAGWQSHLEDLAEVVAGRTPGDWAVRWRELVPAYRSVDR